MLAIKKHPSPFFFLEEIFCSPYKSLNTAPHDRIERKKTVNK